MWFSGKKFRRIRCENIDKLLAATNVNDDVVRTLKMTAPLVTYSMTDQNTLRIDLEVDGRNIMSYSVRLGEEQEMEKRDGGKIKITYTLEGDSILKQVIKMPDGKTAYFRREFNRDELKMIVTMDGTDVTATIYYEIVQ